MNLPEGWEIENLGDVCKIDKSKYTKSSFPYVGLEDIESGTGNFLGSHEPRIVQSSTFQFTSKHLLYQVRSISYNKVSYQYIEIKWSKK